MEQATKKLLMCVLMLAALPVVAEPINGETDGSELASSEMVKVVTQTAQASDCLAPVAVYKVDGETVVVPAHGFLIEPGVHTINGRATLDSSKCRPIDGDNALKSVPDLEVTFEFGNTYYIAYDRRSPNPDEWGLVVWKMEEDTTLSRRLP